MLRSCSTLLALVAWVGCAPMQPAAAPAGIQLRAEPGELSPGDSLVLVLENGTDEALGYNLCTSGLEQRSGDAWRPVALDRVCTMELRMLEPNQQARFADPLPADLAPGEYRAVTGVERMASGGRQDVASEPFRVLP
jgi:hypothetical protein